MKIPIANASSRPANAAVSSRARSRLTTNPPTPKINRPVKRNANDGAVAKSTAPTTIRDNPANPALSGGQRSTASPTGIAMTTAGKLMEPISSPI